VYNGFWINVNKICTPSELNNEYVCSFTNRKIPSEMMYGKLGNNYICGRCKMCDTPIITSSQSDLNYFSY
jgi:hypothetical protein